MRELDSVRVKRATWIEDWRGGEDERWKLLVPRHTLGTIVSGPVAGYALVEFDPWSDGGFFFAEVPTRYLEAA